MAVQLALLPTMQAVIQSVMQTVIQPVGCTSSPMYTSAVAFTNSHTAKRIAVITLVRTYTLPISHPQNCPSCYDGANKRLIIPLCTAP